MSSRVVQAGCGCAFLHGPKDEYERLTWCKPHHEEEHMTDTTQPAPEWPHRNRMDLEALRNEIAHHPKFTSEDDSEAYLMRRVVDYCEVVLAADSGPSFTAAYANVLGWMNEAAMDVDETIYRVHLAVRHAQGKDQVHGWRTIVTSDS